MRRIKAPYIGSVNKKHIMYANEFLYTNKQLNVLDMYANTLYIIRMIV